MGRNQAVDFAPTDATHRDIPSAPLADEELFFLEDGDESHLLTFPIIDGERRLLLRFLQESSLSNPVTNRDTGFQTWIQTSILRHGIVLNT